MTGNTIVRRIWGYQTVPTEIVGMVLQPPYDGLRCQFFFEES